MEHTLTVDGNAYDVQLVAECGSKRLYRAENGMYFFEEDVTSTEVSFCDEQTAQDFIAINQLRELKSSAPQIPNQYFVNCSRLNSWVSLGGVMKELTPKEKMQMVRSGAFYSAEFDGVLSWNDEGRASIRTDIRTWIHTRLKEEGITQAEMAEYLHKGKTNLNSYLKGHIPFSLESVEQMIWILTPGNCRMKDDE